MDHRLTDDQCSIAQSKVDVSNDIDKGACVYCFLGANGCKADKRVVVIGKAAGFVDSLEAYCPGVGYAFDANYTDPRTGRPLTRARPYSHEPPLDSPSGSMSTPLPPERRPTHNTL